MKTVNYMDKSDPVIKVSVSEILFYRKSYYFVILSVNHLTTVSALNSIS